MLHKFLYLVGKHPWLLLALSVVLSEVVTMTIATPMTYFFFGGFNANIYIALVCGFTVSLIVCEIVLVLARQSTNMKHELEGLKRSLNIGEDGKFISNLSTTDFMSRASEEIDRGSRHRFNLILLKVRIKNLPTLQNTLPKEQYFLLKDEITEKLKDIKRSYDLITNENHGEVFVILLNQVVRGCAEQVCQRFYSDIENHKFIVKYSDNSLTPNIVKVNVSLAAVEFVPTKTTSISNISAIADNLLNSTNTYTHKTLPWK